ncbi:MAG: Hsp20/alpha crystallin family protein [Deltaproteobacteria bacterium]|nr:Hsp20/alpha crystallin family protein [Deltaproteobacteria bacterium]
MNTTESTSSQSGRHYRPDVNIRETSDAFLLHLDMPGTKAETISLTFDNGTLHVQGDVAPRQPDSTEYLLREYGVGNFSRSFEINRRIDAANISADYSDGVLTVTVPKAEDSKPKKIQVKVEPKNLN